MARPRKKKRTHVGAHNGPKTEVSSNPASKDPKSMVIRIGAGDVGPSISQLVQDVRRMMEPGTASRLKERRSNRLRDYTAMAGPLGISHLLLFSRSDAGNTHLRLALTPRGPTLHFRVEQYSLAKDVRKAQRHPKGAPKDFLSPPLLVMNNFTSPLPPDGSQPAVPKHLESLTTTIFQSLFPPISPQATPLSAIRRILLLNRETSKPENGTDNGTFILKLRHYAITTKRIGLSRGVRRLNAAESLLKQRNKRKAGMPNLGKLGDMADYINDPSATASGFTSGSDSEVETDAEVEVLDGTTRKVLSKQQIAATRSADGLQARADRHRVEKRAVKMVELGPRMQLRMTKVEEGVCAGKVMWHEYLSKTPEEVRKMEAFWEQRRNEKEERRRLQRENVLRKKEKLGSGDKEHVDGNATGGTRDEDEDIDMDEISEDEWYSEGVEGGIRLETTIDDAISIG